MEKREAEFRLLERRALGVITDETEPDEHHKDLTVVISSSSSFDDYSNWAVFADAQETSFVLRKMVWRRTFDLQRFRDPLAGLQYGWSIEPTLLATVINLPTSRVEELISTARSLDVPELGLSERLNYAIVLDGIRWFVFVSGAFGNKSYNWNAFPPEWEPVVSWTQQMIAFLNDVIDATQG